jgi:hypothetical protein
MRYACERCREEVALRDELSHLERARLAAHLEACTACRSFADRWAVTIECARASVPMLTLARKDAILNLIGIRCEPPRKHGSPRRRAAAFVALAAGLVLFALVRPGSEEVAGPVHLPRETARLPAAAPAALPAAATASAETPRPAVAGAARREPRPTPRAEPRERKSALAPPAEIAPPRARDLPLALDAGTLYAEAERAMEEGRPAETARLLEELVIRRPDTPEAQTARLELGMLYAGDLDEPARAVDHLSAFVAREREPSARGAARALLCQLVPVIEGTRVCWPGVAALGEKMSQGSAP